MIKENNLDHQNIKPFLRWAGGKQWLANRLVLKLPENTFTYFEPFLGGASLYFAARPKKAILSDINEKLILTYRVVRDRPNDIIAILSKWKNDETTYYKIRGTDYKESTKQAAQFIYLNKTCWNGLYRVNQKGVFNVPFGYNGRQIFSRENLLQISVMLQNAEIICCDFHESMRLAKAGDFVYFDPPYTVLHSKNGFRRYNEKLFSWQDQIRLALCAHQLSDKGCHVVVSNADNQEVRRLYRGFLFQSISRTSILASNPEKRRRIKECLFVSSERLSAKRKTEEGKNGSIK